MASAWDLPCCGLGGIAFCGCVVAFDLLVVFGLLLDVIAWLLPAGLGLDFSGGFPVVFGFGWYSFLVDLRVVFWFGLVVYGCWFGSWAFAVRLDMVPSGCLG